MLKNEYKLVETPRLIWGKLIIYLRENRHIALHIACGDIFNVDIVDNQFIIKSTEQYLIDIMTSEENMNILKKGFESLGKNYIINVVKETKKSELIENDINVLKEHFAKYLTIKE